MVRSSIEVGVGLLPLAGANRIVSIRRVIDKGVQPRLRRSLLSEAFTRLRLIRRRLYVRPFFVLRILRPRAHEPMEDSFNCQEYVPSRRRQTRASAKHVISPLFDGRAFPQTLRASSIALHTNRNQFPGRYGETRQRTVPGLTQSIKWCRHSGTIAREVARDNTSNTLARTWRSTGRGVESPVLNLVTAAERPAISA